MQDRSWNLVGYGVPKKSKYPLLCFTDNTTIVRTESIEKLFVALSTRDEKPLEMRSVPLSCRIYDTVDGVVCLRIVLLLDAPRKLGLDEVSTAALHIVLNRRKVEFENVESLVLAKCW